MLIFRRIFLSNYWWQESDIWSQASYRYTILWVAFLYSSDYEHICSMCIKINKVGKQEVGIWWVQKRFPRYGVPIWSLWPNIRFPPSSATIDGGNLIFGHKLHIGTPYRGKRFWTHQIPTSCLPTLLIFIHIEHICSFFVAFKICWEKCDEKCAYMLNVYKSQLSRQTGSRNLTGQKTLPTKWGTYINVYLLNKNFFYVTNFNFPLQCILY
jgi:hypothetical protein